MVSESPPGAGTQGTSLKSVIVGLRSRGPEHKPEGVVAGLRLRGPDLGVVVGGLRTRGRKHKPKRSNSGPEARRARTKDWKDLKPRVCGNQTQGWDSEARSDAVGLGKEAQLEERGGV